MRKKLSLAFLLLLVAGSLLQAAPRLRVVIMTDFPPVDVVPGGMGFGAPERRSDSDDVQSMVRFLLYTNEFDVEGLIATSGTFANVANKQNLLDMLYLYEAVQPNLQQHDNRYPTADALRRVTWQGRSGTWGKKADEIVGKDCDSEASEQIIRLLEEPDTRPVWFCVWGGTADLAQALWKIQQTRPRAEAERLMAKVRVYMIALQDGSGQWLLDTFPQLFTIMSRQNYMGMFWNAVGSDPSVADLKWVNQHIRRGHGLLGMAYPESGFYPDTPGVWEGDSPSYLYLVSAALGISDAEKPDQPSWGGRFIRPDADKNHWFDSPEGGKAVYQWRAQFQEDFAKRADWMLPPAK